MGKVVVRATLKNGVDEALARRGKISNKAIRGITVDALVDTGAVQCVIPSFVAQKLGLAEVGRQVVKYADGREESVPLSETVVFEIEGRRSAEECLILGDEVLIGQTALEKTDLHVDCKKRKLAGNPEHPNQPVITVKSYYPTARHLNIRK
ncbi:MAG: retroviral-like aspartic protease family protein [Spirochaetota bacterium]